MPTDTPFLDLLKAYEKDNTSDPFDALEMLDTTSRNSGAAPKPRLTRPGRRDRDPRRGADGEARPAPSSAVAPGLGGRLPTISPKGRPDLGRGPRSRERPDSPDVETIPMSTTAVRRTIRVGHSPDSDDAFMFYALTHDKLDTGDLEFVHQLEDIETLNRRALQASLRSPPSASTPSPTWPTSTPCSPPGAAWATATAPS